MKSDIFVWNEKGNQIWMGDRGGRSNCKMISKEK